MYRVVVNYQIFPDAFHGIKAAIHLTMDQENPSKGAFPYGIDNFEVLELDYFLIFHLTVERD